MRSTRRAHALRVVCRGYVLAAALLITLASGQAWSEWLRAGQDVMGTTIHVELWHEDSDTRTRAAAAVFEEMHRIDRLWSPHRNGSDINTLNRDAALQPTPVTAETITLIGHALDFGTRSGGAFDISFAAVGHLYDYRNKIKPDAAAIATHLPFVDYRQVIVDPAKRQIRFGKPGMKIDLGGIAKGYAVERAAAILRSFRIGSAMVSAGGDMRILGDKRGRAWVVGIKHPRRAGEMAALLPLQDTALSTSGDYERFFLDADGTRHHHILDPKTGRSADQCQSVSIIGADGTMTDGLSTTLFVLGPQAGLKLLARDFPGYDAVIIDRDGKLIYSEGLMQMQKRDDGAAAGKAP